MPWTPALRRHEHCFIPPTKGGVTVTKARLIGVDRGDRAPTEFRLKQAEITVGSEAGNSLVLKHDSVSRRHALIRRQGKRFELTDLKSTNGTFINGHRLQVPTLLEDRSAVRFGGVGFVFLDPAFRRSSRGTTKLRTKVRRTLEAALILFLIGFGLTQYLLNGDNLKRIIQRMTTASSSTPTTLRVTPTTSSTIHTKASPSEARVSREPEIPAGPPWLRRLNYYRKLAGVAPVGENDALSDGDRKHARYIVENYGALLKTGTNLGAAMHTEESGQPWYTPEGFAAAQNSDVYEGCSKFDAASAIDGWIEAPFHRFSALNPNITGVGFGEYRKADCWAMGLDLHLGPDTSSLARPIEFPPPNSDVALTFDGGEWPDPLTACPGYRPPIGLPITLETGLWMDAKLGSHALLRGTEPIAHCAFDTTNYFNEDPVTQKQAREGLRAYGAVVLIPRDPLIPGETYKVAIESQGKTYRWSFKVASQDETLAGN